MSDTGEELQRMLDYTEDVQSAIESLRRSSEFYLLCKENDQWKRSYNASLVEVLAALKIASDEISDELRGKYADTDNDDS
jgi:hypothetical protein